MRWPIENSFVYLLLESIFRSLLLVPLLAFGIFAVMVALFFEPVESAWKPAPADPREKQFKKLLNEVEKDLVLNSRSRYATWL